VVIESASSPSTLKKVSALAFSRRSNSPLSEGNSEDPKSSVR